MKLSKSVMIAVMNNGVNGGRTGSIPVDDLSLLSLGAPTVRTPGADTSVQPTAIETALAAGCDVKGSKPNAFEGGCISDEVCNNVPGHRIFNHFNFASVEDAHQNRTLELVPECRKIDDSPTPGFSCGTDTRLKSGTEVVIPNVPETGYSFDNRAGSFQIYGHTKFSPDSDQVFIN